MNPPPQPSNPTQRHAPPPTSPTQNLHTTLLSALQTRHSLPVSPQWVTSFLSTLTATANGPTATALPPFPSLLSTAHFRLLTSDITTSLTATSTSTFPPSITDKHIKSTTLPHDVPCQILDIEDAGSSRYTLLEGIERVERGEEVKGREVVRVVAGLDDESGGSGSTSAITGGTASRTGNGMGGGRSSGPHTLIVQDARGAKFKLFEMAPVEKLFVTVAAEGGGVCIGCKIVVKRGCEVRRGVVMGGGSGEVVVLGGKVREWDEAWRRGRKERLKREMERAAGGRGADG